MTKNQRELSNSNFDVCLSFAGEDRQYVEKVAHLLQNAGVRTFYDNFEKTNLWGKDLYSHLDDIYRNKATYCVIFISKHYAEKAWTKHERRSAQARSFNSGAEYILPARSDDTEIPGIQDTIGYLDLREITPKELSETIIAKIGPRPRENYLPPVPDRLFKHFRVRSKRDQEFLTVVTHSFFRSLTMMNAEERKLIYDIFTNCCPAELPENVHIDLDLLRRITGIPPAKIKRITSGIQSLGFNHFVRASHNPDDPTDRSGPVLVLEWQNMILPNGGNHTYLANEIIQCVTDNYCSEHAELMFKRLDFGQLATSTTIADEH